MDRMPAQISLALLLTMFIIYISNAIGDILVRIDKSVVQDIYVATEENPTEEIAKIVPTTPSEINAIDLIKSVDIEVGKKAFKKCVSCHSLKSGANHKVGPNLWSIVGRSQGSADGYNYSHAFSNLDGYWSFEALDNFLINPKVYLPGNKMSFKGIKDAEVRAALILYLNLNADSPLPLP